MFWCLDEPSTDRRRDQPEETMLLGEQSFGYPLLDSFSHVYFLPPWNLSEATKASLDVDCEVEEEPSAACVDYGNFLDQLYILRDALDSSGSKSSKMKLGDVVKNIKLSPPSDGKAAPSSPKLTAALAEAKKATSEHGITSPEARLAWESYEEIASSGLDNAIGINLAEECDIESGLEACRAMEELQNILPVLQAVASE